MKKIQIVATAAIALGILLVSSLAMASPQQKNEVGITATPTCIPGEIFTGDYIRVGINPGGTLGVTNGTNMSTCIGDPGVGFQWAGDAVFTFPSTESAAIAFWGEGYKLAYKEEHDGVMVDTVAFYQPDLGYPPPPISKIIPISETLIMEDDQKAVKEVKVMTNDSKLELTFLFTFLKRYPELNLQTTIKNIGSEPVRDVVYTRIWDIDVCSTFGNTWASTGHEAYAWDVCPPIPSMPFTGKNVTLTIAGHDGALKNPRRVDIPMPVVNYVDLYAWDDQFGLRSPGFFDVQSFAPVPFVDFNAGVYYKIGELERGDSATVYTVYQSNFPLAPGVTPK